MTILTILYLQILIIHKIVVLTSERININPEIFSDAPSLDTLHEKWFINLSSIDIPLEVKYLLQLGEKFGLPINKNNKEKTLIEFIKQIENNIIGRLKNIINFVRNNSISILNRFQNNFPSPNFFDKQISNWLHITNKFINNHPNILITNADKGNVTVVLDKDTYITKMEEILSDSNTYEVIARDPIRRLTQDLRALLVRWKRDSYIDDQTYRRLLTTDGVIPRADDVILALPSNNINDALNTFNSLHTRL
ncbi:hypothetical protein ALC57_17413 [Trachymyrmex cornetzi]|uniref:Uncharacterized protein n=1 Tax=Trachymyrmex cornetzi TaxID=471704 RepID=A0A151ITQ0_9HYME|nr:hypothetical protein ALC57_17413 [Trachymyrmex cornetzi]